MEVNLKNKVAVLTGGGGGIGRATAQMMAKEGIRVVLLGGRNPQKLEQTRQLVEKTSDCLVLPGDLGDLSLHASWMETIEKHWGQIDILINNAGMALNCPFESVTPEQFDEIFKINIRSPYFLTQAALPYLRKSHCGTIINISSVLGHTGYPFQSAYAASKHAILGFTKSLANELYQEGIRVHAISPGGVYTDMVKVARPDLTGEGMISPEEIAEIIHFFLHYKGNAVIDEINVHRVNKEPFLV